MSSDPLGRQFFVSCGLLSGVPVVSNISWALVEWMNELGFVLLWSCAKAVEESVGTWRQVFMEDWLVSNPLWNSEDSAVNRTFLLPETGINHHCLWVPGHTITQGKNRCLLHVDWMPGPSLTVEWHSVLSSLPFTSGFYLLPIVFAIQVDGKRISLSSRCADVYWSSRAGPLTSEAHFSFVSSVCDAKWYSTIFRGIWGLEMGLVQVSQPRGTAGTSVASLSFPLLGNIWYSRDWWWGAYIARLHLKTHRVTSWLIIHTFFLSGHRILIYITPRSRAVFSLLEAQLTSLSNDKTHPMMWRLCGMHFWSI